MKKLFTLIAALFGAVSMNAEEVDITSLFSYTWGSAEEESLVFNEDGSIIYNSKSWGGMAAWLVVDDVKADWSGYKKVVFEFADPTTVSTQILVGEASGWGNPGITSLEADFTGKDMSAVEQIALQTSDPTTLIVKRVYLVTKDGSEPDPQPQPTDGVLWEGSALVTGWANQPTFLSDGGKELKDAGAEAGDYIYFYASAPTDEWQVELFEGHWGGMYERFSAKPLDNNEDGTPRESTVVDLAGKGYFAFQLTQEVLDKAYTAGGWGGVFLLNGDGDLTVTKLELVKAGQSQGTTVTFAVEEGATYYSGQTLTFDGITLTFGEEGGNDFDVAKAASIEGNDTFKFYTPGNGVNGNKEGGTFYVLKPENNGKITVAVVLNADKKFHISEDGTDLPNYEAITVSDKYLGTFDFDVKGGSTYKVWCDGSKLGFFGFIYTSEGGSSNVESVKTVATETVATYNLRGQRVDANYKGVVIRNGKKFFQK